MRSNWLSLVDLTYRFPFGLPQPAALFHSLLLLQMLINIRMYACMLPISISHHVSSKLCLYASMSAFYFQYFLFSTIVRTCTLYIIILEISLTSLYSLLKPFLYFRYQNTVSLICVIHCNFRINKHARTCCLSLFSPHQPLNVRQTDMTLLLCFVCVGRGGDLWVAHPQSSASSECTFTQGSKYYPGTLLVYVVGVTIRVWVEWMSGQVVSALENQNNQYTQRDPSWLIAWFHF